MTPVLASDISSRADLRQQVVCDFFLRQRLTEKFGNSWKSPTKTPEYLAAGKPVISTSIRDVVRPYGQHGLARIADTVEEFVAAVDAALAEPAAERIRAADAFLTHTSWDGTWTWTRMRLLIEETMASRNHRDRTRIVSAS